MILWRFINSKIKLERKKRFAQSNPRAGSKVSFPVNHQFLRTQQFITIGISSTLRLSIESRFRAFK